jgi:nucleotide-binding universal stress UspA family protein
MKTIVVGYDGSDGAKRALERAASLCKNETNLLVVLAESVVMPLKGALAVVDPIEAEEGKRALGEARSWLRERGIAAELVEAHGDPVKAICGLAEDVHADLVVVGTRGHGTIGRLLLGSVSTGVVEHAPCDVLVVR